MNPTNLFWMIALTWVILLSVSAVILLIVLLVDATLGRAARVRERQREEQERVVRSLRQYANDKPALRCIDGGRDRP